MPSQNAAPGAQGWNVNRPSSCPSRRWSRFFASSIRCRCALSSASLKKARPVDPLHRLVARVALPIGVRGVEQLERLEPAGRRHVRADAEVDEGVSVLDGVAGDLATGPRSSPRSAAPSAVRRAARRTPIASSRGHICRSYGRSAAASSFIFASMRFEILRHERTLDDEIVEEALVGRRADPALRAGKESGHGCRQKVRRAVPIERQRLRIVRICRDDADLRVAVERVARDRPGGRRPSRQAPRARARARSTRRSRRRSYRRARFGSSRPEG